MTKFYSETTRGFYDAAIHGARTMQIVDPAWICPQIEHVDTDPETGETVDRYMIDDPDAVPDTIKVSNPDCKIPADAVEITDADHAALLEGQSAGATIQADAGGNPIAVMPAPPTLAAINARLAASINAEIKAICDNFSSFSLEYTAREAAAIAFKAGGYVGDAEEPVMEFARPARMTARQATDRILAQAVGLRAASSALGGLRMRKYEIIFAADEIEAQAIHDDISAKAKIIAASI